MANQGPDRPGEDGADRAMDPAAGPGGELDRAGVSPEATVGRTWTRRQVLTVGLGGAVAVLAAGAGGLELVSHGVLPGKGLLDEVDGACSVSSPKPSYSALGQSMSGSFYSRARHRDVGYTIALPPGHAPGASLPLIVMLHGFGANHTNALSGMSAAQAVALQVDGQPLAPMAMVTVDGGGGYWNPHPHDNPMAMVIDELIPMCQRRGLGKPPQGIGTMGISMGGYGALLLAEKYPHLIDAVAAISPAIWTSFSEARNANAGAYASAIDFDADNAVTHAAALAGVPVRVASGNDDPFHPGVVALARALPPGAIVEFSSGCHTGPFFNAQEPPSLAFLAGHLR
jgi:pimeloyl-ACP methyl ester carboxylesterase